MEKKKRMNYHKCVCPGPLNVVLVKHLTAKPIFPCHDGDVTFEIKKGSSALAKSQPHTSAGGSVNPRDICQSWSLELSSTPAPLFHG